MSDPRSLTFTTIDGVELVGDVAEPTPAFADVVLCHPHPAYGGDRFNTVTSALFNALPPRGGRTLRFDFRDALRTPSADLTGGLLDAARDVAAAIDVFATGDASPDTPLVVIGYSYGALATLEMLAAGLAATEPTAMVLIAPPLALHTATLTTAIPALIAVPEHDQFSAPDAAAAAIGQWPDDVRRDLEVITVPMADHFLAGRTAAVVEETVGWLSRRALLPSRP